jgi:HAD superfamily hydrolase (TIGR01509 family)
LNRLGHCLQAGSGEGLNIKGVLVDFGDTLAYPDENGNRRYHTALLSTLRKYGYQRHLSNLTSILDASYGSSTKGELKSMREFWGVVLDKLQIPEQPRLVDDLEEIRSSHAGELVRIYDGAHSTLSTLRKKYKLALVSNCTIGTDKLIDASGLADFFLCIVLSYDAAARKPERSIYLKALGCLELAADECVFVADEISDLEGARAVGLKTILVRQGPHTFHEAKDPDFKPDFQCDHISDVTKFL